MSLKTKDDVPDVTEQQPERFKRAVRAGCNAWHGTNICRYLFDPHCQKDAL